MHIIWITTLYPARDQTRRDEYNQCLEINCNSCIDRIIVLYEGDDHSYYPNLKHPKVSLANIDRRTTYQDMIDYADQHISPDDVVIFGNADIYFDEDSNVHRAKEIKPGELWALCRWQQFPKKHKWHLFGKGLIGSFDSYIFRPPLKKFDTSFQFGILGCDSCFVFRAVVAGLTVCGPSLSIRSKHLHNSAERNYVRPNYWKRWDHRIVLKPCTIESGQRMQLSSPFKRALLAVALFAYSGILKPCLSKDYTRRLRQRIKSFLQIG